MYQSDNTEMYLSVFKYSGGYVIILNFMLEGIEGQEEGHSSRKGYNIPFYTLVIQFSLCLRVYLFESTNSAPECTSEHIKSQEKHTLLEVAFVYIKSIQACIPEVLIFSLL